MPGSVTNARQAENDFVLVLRDVNDGYHARWVRSDDVSRLPPEIQVILRGEEVDVHFWESAVATADAQEVLGYLREHHNVLLYGPPGTGKTHLMQQVLRLFANRTLQVDTESERVPVVAEGSARALVRWVTFHQSYSYEEFIVGLRPDTQAATTKLLDLRPAPGVLLEIAEFSRPDGQESLLVIDEINRGNVSRIFGEFITLLEPDKRLGQDGKPTETSIGVQLPYVKAEMPVKVKLASGEVTVPNPFFMPQRVYTLASMNSVDKSVAPLDSALRRRFFVVNLDPDEEAILAEMGITPSSLMVTAQGSDSDPKSLQALSVLMLREINRGIAFFLGQEFRLGHWYLKDVSAAATAEQAIEALGEVWENKIFPQLDELFQGRTEQLGALLRLADNALPSDAPVALEQPSEQLADVGAIPYLTRHQVSSTSVLKFLRFLVRVPIGTTAPTPGPQAQQ